ncbi:putative methylated-DNA:protein-cysteine methyltransferase [Longispora fulva]|uniref:Methylated-DNA-[protein]-cysteine S-methyltransferase n=1 Tax=Longispora fulva TaxID=619741 RepID=A0A8J7GJS9_9ACTN|nr:methylated-DNA--[protein]-cysteine S-methyltransferase [Longispora fulva]MBG6138880.1 methylated-DNA-[protein]-cysteine S-methyltransferase [Longispora fulva]GIG58373.1 putative methylated-DNA:protein-cysteine methyltransferase [Longispora fulva]
MDYTVIPTPAGPFTLVVDVDGVVLTSGFTTDLGELWPQVHPKLRPSGDLRERADLGDLNTVVDRYFEGEVTAIDKVEVRQRGGEFIGAAWDVLRTVTTPVTYSEFAALAGRPAAVRAAAQACARNAVALFVPCHRVIRTDGSLGGFRWGLKVKEQLLHHEAQIR